MTISNLLDDDSLSNLILPLCTYRHLSYLGIRTSTRYFLKERATASMSNLRSKLANAPYRMIKKSRIEPGITFAMGVGSPYRRKTEAMPVLKCSTVFPHRMIRIKNLNSIKNPIQKFSIIRTLALTIRMCPHNGRLRTLFADFRQR